MPGKKTLPGNRQLTEREKEIAQLITDGLSNAMIAKKLNISIQTVNTHRKKIFKKLEVHNIALLIKELINIDSKKLKKDGRK